ncbi:C-type lectin mannose-binding isoform [Biomphalaria pfeifferi]|uniref:C-type lectin mannose-binding isoform n=1 Tax=Biomphalaria pfeifferi TaxID=112525 RepID=A0AAD8EVT2_BIOPF|nr:C-type lectin mannose-binding isoform [Biomphalaria pfeifferi]
MYLAIRSIYFTLSFCLLQSATSFKQFIRVIQKDIGMYPMTSSNYSVFYCPTDRGFNEVAINNTRLCAFVSNTTANYYTAASICKQNNGLLMTVKTPERVNLLKALMRNNSCVYIGLDDIVQEGNFVWSDGTLLSQTEMAIFNVGTPTPTNSAEDCVVYYRIYGANDLSCNKLQQYVCEFIP